MKKEILREIDEIERNLDNLKIESSKIYDYKSIKNESRVMVARKSADEIMKRSREIADKYPEAKKIYELSEILKKKIGENEKEGILKITREMKSLINNINEPEYSKEIQSLRLPEEIREETEDDVSEMIKCFESGCYKSALIVCGRILETVLYRKYYEATGNDLLETAPDLGLGKIIAKLKEKNVSLPPGLTEQIHLINNIRIVSVHKKKRIFKPSKSQTEAIILFTIDAVKKIF